MSKTHFSPTGANAWSQFNRFYFPGFPIGNVFYVNSVTGVDSAGYGYSPEAPLATLDYAVRLTTATNGDVIFLAPGHAETIATGTALALDVAGITIVGLGNGRTRPTFTFSATTSNVAITAANITLQNIRVTSSVNELVVMFTVSAAGVTFDAVDYIDPGSAKETLQFVLTTSAADDLTIKNCNHYASTAGNTAQLWIALVSCDRPKIVDNSFHLVLKDHATSCVISGDATVTAAEIGRNKIVMLGYSAATLSAVLMASGATGIHYDSRLAADTAALTTINDCPTMYSFEVYCSNDVDKNGIIDPGVAS